MAWGAGGGGAIFGGGAPAGRPAAPGLPFGGIPSELQAGVDKLLASETHPGEPGVSFLQVPGAAERRRLTLWLLLTQYPGMLWLAGLFVVVVSVSTQAGPYLTEYAINNGMVPGHQHFSVVATAAGVYLLSVLVSALCQRGQVKVTGRLAA
ncbi:MAG TPA: hypothetical protein VKA05_07185, partial [Acidimicrobiales bacterium]|nr:hypothetical protein [Acidimicrobiales bacterium]